MGFDRMYGGILKQFVCILIAVMLMGCVSGPKFVIPDEPKFKQLYIYPVNGGICLDEEGIGVLKDNMKALKDSEAAMRKILEGIQKGK